MASYLTGLCLEKQDIQFVNTDGSLGALLQVPTPENGGVVDGDVWATPINYGTYSGWVYQPYNPTNKKESVPPTFFSQACVKISSRFSSDWWYVLGTAADYVGASAGGAPLPTTWPVVTHSKAIAPVCQKVDTQDVNGNYIIVLALPTQAAGEYLFPYGVLDGVQLPSSTANGYLTVASLLVFLNANWTNVGCPTSSITWTVSADQLTLIGTETSGRGIDEFCGVVLNINPSA